MGVLGTFVDRRLAHDLSARKVLLWYDPARSWQRWVEAKIGLGSLPQKLTRRAVHLGEREAQIVASGGSHYEVLQACEELLAGTELPQVLVYIPGEPYLEAHSPLRELECLGGEKEPYQKDLAQVARQAFQSAGLAESKIDELLNREGLDFEYLDSISVGASDASPFSPIFGSSREIDVFPAFLADPVRRAQAAAKGLLQEIAQLAQKSLGLAPAGDVAESTPAASAETLAHQISRQLLVAELRSDLAGPEPVAISQIPGPRREDQIEQVRAVCRKLRRDHGKEYEALADSVEKELHLASLDLAPGSLGRIDTFRFEERRLLEACDAWLAQGEAERARDIVRERMSEGSFWTSVLGFPERHAAWEACERIADLALAIDSVAGPLAKAPKNAAEWLAAYTAADGWHRLDQMFRDVRYRMTKLQGANDLEKGSEHVFGRYDALVNQMAIGFVSALQESAWQIPGALRQEEIFDRHVARRGEPVAYILADALRFEMGAELVRLLEGVGATAVQLEPALAAAPTVTGVGMAALLPGAERSFSIGEHPKGIAGAIGGKTLVGSAARMDHAKGQVPGLVEMTLDRLVHELSGKARAEELQDAKIVLIRSQEIDGAGEALSFGVAQKVMGTILEDLRTAAQRLSEAGIHRFVVTADHGHLFGQLRGDDMKIETPEGGKTVELHRRCWVGRGGTTPSSCVRVSAAQLGYEGTDLDLLVPKGTGVFKAGGSLAYHHGGLSLQELVIPVLRFALAAPKAAGKKPTGDPLVLENVPTKITNRIFSVRIQPQQLTLFGALKVRVIGQATSDGSTVAQAGEATDGWEPLQRVVTLGSNMPVDVRLVLDDDQIAELRIVVMEVETDRVLKDSAPIPVRLGVY